MIFEKVRKERRNIISVQYPFSSPEAALRVGRKRCYFCGKSFSKCDFLGITFSSDKGSKMCCDSCAKKFEKGLENEA